MSGKFPFQAVGVAVFLFHSPQTAQAENHQPIVITPASVEQPRNQANTPVTVIDRQTIEASNAVNLAGLLRGQAGLHVSDLFGDGSQASFDLRGFGPSASRNTLVLVDGRRLNNSADSATPDLSAIDPDDIERIEIFQGSAGVLYGNQAVGGVVNIIRRRITDNRGSASVAASSFGGAKARGSVDRIFGQTRLAVSLATEDLENYRDHNDNRRNDAMLRVERQHAGFKAYAELELSDREYETAGALLQSEVDEDRTQSLAFYANDYFDTETETLRLGLEQALDAERAFEVDLSQRNSERDFIQTFRPFAGSLTTQQRETTGLSAVYRVTPDQATRYSSLVFGIDLEQTDYELESILGAQAIDQQIHDLYVSSTWKAGKNGQLDVGFRYSDQAAEISGADYDDSLAVASLGYSWSLDRLRLFARADQNYRYPTVEEHTNVPFGEEPGLDTQQGVSLELGTEYSAGASRFRATVYSIRLEDEIGFDSSGFANLNIDETRRVGSMLELSHRFDRDTRISASLTLLDAEITDGPFAGNQLPLVPEQNLRIDLTRDFSERLSATLELLSVGDQVLSGDFANQLDMLDGYQLVNLQVGYRIQQWKVGARINNLFDEEYAQYGSQYTEYDPDTFAPTHYEAYFPAAERNLWVSAKLEF